MDDFLEALKQKAQTSLSLERIEALNQLAQLLLNSNPAGAMAYATEALQLATQQHYIKGQAQASIQLANLNFREGRYNQAIDHARQAIQHGERENLPGITATGYRNLGRIYGIQGQQEEALTAFLKALRLFEDQQDQPGIAGCYNNLGTLYHGMKDFNQGLAYQLKAASIFEELNDRINLALVYNNIGANLTDRQEFDQALSYYQKSVACISQDNPDYYVLGNVHYNMGFVCESRQNYQAALDYYQQGIRFQEQCNDKNGLSFSYYSIGTSHLALGDFEQALHFLELSTELAIALSNPHREHENYGKIAEAYEKKGDFERAVFYHKRYIALLEEIFDETKSRQVVELQAKYDVERKEHEAEIYRLKTLQLEEMVAERTQALHESLEREQTLAHELRMALAKEVELGRLKSQVIEVVSHEFRTPLTIINTSAHLLKRFHETLNADLRLERLNKIQDAVHNLTMLLDEALIVNRIDTLIAFSRADVLDLRLVCEELLETLQAEYIPPANFHLDYQQGADYVLQLNVAFIREVLTQLLNNAVKYAPAGSPIRLTLDTIANGLTITIQDNGIGIPVEEQAGLFTPFFRASNAINMRGIGLGLSIAKTLTEIMNGRITVQSEGQNKGSRFMIYLPKE